MNKRQNDWVNNAVIEWSDPDFNLNSEKQTSYFLHSSKPGEIVSSWLPVKIDRGSC